MAKVFFRMVLIILGLIGLVALVGYLLPREYSTSSSVTIDAPLEQVFERVNTTEHWTKWSPWSPDRIANMTVAYEGEPKGKGAVMTWQDPRPGNRFDGRMEITSSTDRERIEFNSIMGQIPMDGYFTFEEINGQTKVTWSVGGKLPSGVFYGWFGLAYNGFLRSELEGSLNRLKEVCEEQE